MPVLILLRLSNSSESKGGDTDRYECTNSIHETPVASATLAGHLASSKLARLRQSILQRRRQKNYPIRRSHPASGQARGLPCRLDADLGRGRSLQYPLYMGHLGYLTNQAAQLCFGVRIRVPEVLSPQQGQHGHLNLCTTLISSGTSQSCRNDVKSRVPLDVHLYVHLYVL